MKRFHVVLFLLLGLLALAQLSIVDDLGRVVKFDAPPSRVVSAAPSVTRYLLALGLENTIKGVTDWDFYKKAERIGNMVPLNVEKIVSLSPDLILLFGGFQASEVKKLEKFNLRALVLNPLNLKDILKDLVLLGIVFNVEEKAKELSEELENKMLEIAKETYKIPPEKRPRVLYLMGAPESGMKEFWTAVSGSYMNDLINYAGGRNIAADITGPNGWAPISLEFIVDRDPEVIIVANFIPGGEEKIVNEVLSFEPFSEISAVKNRRVYAVDGNLASQPSPDIFKLLDELHKLFYKGKR